MYYYGANVCNVVPFSVMWCRIYGGAVSFYMVPVKWWGHCHWRCRFLFGGGVIVGGGVVMCCDHAVFKGCQKP